MATGHRVLPRTLCPGGSLYAVELQRRRLLQWILRWITVGGMAPTRSVSDNLLQPDETAWPYSPCPKPGAAADFCCHCCRVHTCTSTGPMDVIVFLQRLPPWRGRCDLLLPRPPPWRVPDEERRQRSMSSQLNTSQTEPNFWRTMCTALHARTLHVSKTCSARSVSVVHAHNEQCCVRLGQLCRAPFTRVSL